MPEVHVSAMDMATAAEGPAEDAAEQEAEEAAERAAEQAAQEAEEAAERAAEQAAQEAEEAAEEAAEQAAQEAEEAAEEAAEQAAQEAEEAAEEAAEQAAHEAEKAAEEAAEQAAHEAEKQAEKMAENIYRLGEREDLEDVEAPEDDKDRDHDEERGEPEGRQDDEDASGKGDGDSSDDRRGPGTGPVEAAGLTAARADKFTDLYDDDGFEAVADEILLLAETDRTSDLEDAGYAVAERQYLEGLDLVLVRMTAPKEAELSDSAVELAARQAGAQVDLNHLFSSEADALLTPAYSTADLSGQVKLPDRRATAGVSLGLIDTRVDQSHAALRGGDILIRDLVPYERARPRDHGTAVASILVGDEPGVFRGVAAGARLYAASVFFEISPGRTAATTESLILALDWLLREQVRVINMSLSGPPNKLLEVAVRRVAEKGGVIIAAVGNGGPASAPLYPAAYPGVVAVTAVDEEKHVYLRANRGAHVAFAAPGVNIPVARAGGGYRAQSGTSIAAPFVSAVVADMMLRQTRRSPRNMLEVLQKNSLDLGPPGFDNIYGHGLIRSVAD